MRDTRKGTRVKDRRITIRLTTDLWQDLHTLAENDVRTISEQCRRLLAAHCHGHRGQKGGGR